MLKICSGGFKFGRLNCNYIFDASYLPNPWRKPNLKGAGLSSSEISNFFNSHEEYIKYRTIIRDFVVGVASLYPNEDISIGIMCSSGKYRSPFLANDIAKELGVEAFHRDV